MSLRYPLENAFDGIVARESARTGVSMALLKAIIALESEFVPSATRAEPARSSLPPTPDFPNGGDVSVGLMQVLVRTARLLGYRGEIGDKKALTGLYDPSTNIQLGATLIRDNVNVARAQGLGIDAAVSAYNGGWRPSLGYGKPLPNGQFANQAYVNVVFKNLAYFGATPEEMTRTAAPAVRDVPTVPLAPGIDTTAPAPGDVELTPAADGTLSPLPGGLAPMSDDGGATSALVLVGIALGVAWLALRLVDARGGA